MSQQLRKLLICQRFGGDYVLMSDLDGRTVSRQLSHEQGERCLRAFEEAIVKVLGDAPLTTVELAR